MACESILKGKRFFCREWVFAKIHHCLENRHTAKTCGALIIGGPGSGKSAICAEIAWPVATSGKQKTLNKWLLASHFCQAHDDVSLSMTSFIHSIIKQIACLEEFIEYAEKIKNPDVQEFLQPYLCDQEPDEAFKRAILFPLLELDPPKHSFFILVDSIDESHMFNLENRSGSRTIAELLANHHHLFPQWLLLVCTARKQSKSVTKLFTGFKKVTLDDLRKVHVVRDVQQYILFRLDQESSLRQHLNRETAEMLNQLHIKSNGCFLYLEKVLDGVAENFILLREIREIPGTLNGLYLWLCQRLFSKKQFAKVQPILNVILTSRTPLSAEQISECLRSRYNSIFQEDFDKRMALLQKVLIKVTDFTQLLFHHSFAEWLLDVKHCTQKYLCQLAEGHGTLALWLSQKGPNLSSKEVQDLALHLTKLESDLSQQDLVHWMVMCDCPVKDCLRAFIPKDYKVLKLLQDCGAILPEICDKDFLHSYEEVIKSDSDDPLSEFLTDKYDFQQLDNNMRTLLHNAAHDGNVELVKILLTREIDIEASDKSGQTALNLAARQGFPEVAEAILKAGANPDHADHEGWTPLRSAAWGGHIGVVEKLLNYGAQVDYSDSDHRTALRAAAWGGHEEIVLKLIKAGANVNKTDNEGRTALIAAAYMGHFEIVEHLLKHGANVNHEDADGRTSLSVAALCVPANEGYARVVGILLENGGQVDHQDKDGMTPLLVAAFEGHREVCELLLEYDADVDHVDHNNRTPLLAAASMGHSDIVELLLFWGCYVDNIDSEGRTVLSVAAAQGNLEIVGQLLDRGLDEMHRDNAGWTPLHYSAFEGHCNIAEALVDAGSRVNEVDNDGKHPLLLAAQEGHAAVVHFLIQAGASVDQKSHDGKTALRVASLEGHKDIVHYLLCNGADVDYKDADGRSTLYVLCLESKSVMVRFLLGCGADLECTDLEGRTPLHVSAWQGNLDMVELLLQSGAYVDAVDNDRRTPLQSAAWQGHSAVVSMLLQYHAHLDHVCNQGATALCIAAQEGHQDCVKILLDSGADPSRSDHCGRNAFKVAMKGGHFEVIKLLEEHGVGDNWRRTTLETVSSVSTAETKPCSAILCPEGTNGLSPDSTWDKRYSLLSLGNNSSGKSSSNLTTSTKSSHTSKPALTEPNPPSQPSHSPPVLTFTQQLQQCSRSRYRPVSHLLSPLNEPHSPIYASPPQSPISDVQSNKPCVISVNSSDLYSRDMRPSINPLLPPSHSTALSRKQLELGPISFTQDGHMKIILGNNMPEGKGRKGSNTSNLRAVANLKNCGLKAISGVMRAPFLSSKNISIKKETPL